MSGSPSKRYVMLNSEVQSALTLGTAVVALESTLIAHGLPHPHNIETAVRLEQIVRDNGATPATIALMDGRVRIGLDTADLERLATADNVAKVSRADIAAILTSGELGATTVAATMIAASLAGIRIFATGGIGGVHRGAADSFDISADLGELCRTPVAVIASGAKTILDLPKTVELLETAGVPVVGFGTDQFPGFYCRDTGIDVPHRFDDIASLAHMLDIHFSLPGQGGALIANPVPAELAMESSIVEAAIQTALAAPEAANLSGKAITPFLLKRLFDLTKGDSLKTNIALIESNTALAAKLAVQFEILAAARKRKLPPQNTYRTYGL